MTLAALNVMRAHAAGTPERKAELDGLLASGVVTQVAINHAGLCDGGERGGSCCPLSPPAPPLSSHPHTPLHRLSCAPSAAASAAACAGARSRLAQHAAIAEAMRANPDGCGRQY